MNTNPKWWKLHHFPFVLFLITMIAVVIGGSIRIYDAGESCPDWPLCFGSWGFDVSEEEQEAWWDENPDEIDSRGAEYRYSQWEIFLEWIHRFVTGIILGPLCIIQCYLAFKRRKEMPAVFKAANLALILVIIQGVMGMITVMYDNVPWSVAAHLTLAMALALSLLWAWVRWMDSDGELPSWMKLDEKSSARILPRLYDLSLSTLAVLIFGAFVSTSSGQNLACNVGTFDAWPLCNGSLVLIDAANLAYGHRMFVLVVGIWLMWNLRGMERGSIRKLLHTGFGFYLANILLGAAYVLTWDDFERILSLLHLMFATFAFLSIGFATLLARNSVFAPSTDEDE
ncbi:MAG: COX15/CtaA family protein [Candidatus Thermoplasmatota archaeon]|nr:COX15/CtaA family protein [Candidatus Thermoplasmatota archaeon]